MLPEEETSAEERRLLAAWRIAELDAQEEADETTLALAARLKDGLQRCDRPAPRAGAAPWWSC